MATSESQQDGASERPNERGAAEWELRRQSELAGQKRASEAGQRKSGSDERSQSASPHEPQGGRSNADQAKANERQAEEEGRELPG